MRRSLIIPGVFLSVLAGGCGSHDPAPLNPQAFFAPATAPATRPAANDVAIAPSVTVPPVAIAAAPTATTPPSTAARPAPPPTIMPATNLAPGTYMVVGTVIAQANGQPIFADKILAKVDAELAAKANQLSPDAFRALATKLITDAVNSERDNELLFAAAQKYTTDDEKQLATMLTMRWRQTEITKSGGSPAVTRWIWMHPDDGGPGIDFDEKVKEWYRRYLTRIYLESRIEPLVKVSPDDMRRFYYLHLDDMFTEKAAVQFRIIGVAVRDLGREGASDRITAAHEKAKRGDDFAALATTYNDSRAWATNGGYMIMEPAKDDDGNPIPGKLAPAWFLRGSMVLKKVEDAVFAIQPGEVTEIIDNGDAFYIARLEARKAGSVLSFDDPAVQTAIRARLESQQRLELQKKEYDRLGQEARWILNKDEQDLTVEMAMQQYLQWRRPAK